jgi:hypothetical protein
MSKIKWNDDRIKQTLTALLPISRTRLVRGETKDLISKSLAEYRTDPASYKEEYGDKSKTASNDPMVVEALKNTKHLDYYKNLLSKTASLTTKFEKNRVQFNSVIELDKYLVTYLKAPELDGGSR